MSKKNYYQNNNKTQNNNALKKSVPASAPYNFIPLNKKFYGCEAVPGSDNLKLNRYYKNRLTGHIDINILTERPVFIRGSFADAHSNPGREGTSPDFFSPGESIRIPGSSLRGMVRTLYEIVTFSKFSFYDDKRLYYRAVADKSNLSSEYKENLVEEKNCKYIGKAGVLVKNGKDYLIKESYKIPYTGLSIYRINFDVCRKNRIHINDNSFQSVYFKPVANIDNFHPRRGITLNYALVNKIKTDSDAEYEEGYLISSGKMFGKHMHWIITSPDNNCSKYHISEEVIKEYNNDKNRDESSNLLKRFSPNVREVPCFFITEKVNGIDTVVAFGHTGMFRIPYKNKIKSFIKQAASETEQVDMAEAVFGKETDFSTRVFFEDAVFSDNEIGDNFQTTEYHKILGEPKATTFQHYLEQSHGADKKILNSYNSDTNIRGNKMYWHRNDEWKYPNPQNTGVTDRITPLKTKKQFKGTIRFENLTQSELGALLFVLDLPDGCRHKIGMGKPLGMGSVKITPVLHISDRDSRYSGFLNESSNIPVVSGRGYIDIFEKYMNAKLGEQNNSLWENERLKELKIMLDYNGKPEAGKTRYLEIEHDNGPGEKLINEYKDRNILPKPSEVK